MDKTISKSTRAALLILGQGGSYQRPGIPLPPILQVAVLARLAAELLYLSETERPLVARAVVATTPAALQAILGQGLQGGGIVEVGTLAGWLRPDLLGFAVGPQSPTLLAARCRALVGYFGPLLDVAAWKFGNDILKRVAFVGRRPGGAWMVLEAEVIET